MNEFAQPVGLMLIALAVAAMLAFLAARRGGDRGAAQVSAGVIVAILLGLVSLVVATLYFGPSD